MMTSEKRASDKFKMLLDPECGGDIEFIRELNNCQGCVEEGRFIVV